MTVKLDRFRVTVPERALLFRRLRLLLELNLNKNVENYAKLALRWKVHNPIDIRHAYALGYMLNTHRFGLRVFGWTMAIVGHEHLGTFVSNVHFQSFSQAEKPF